jgi:hypothetical protein
VQVVVEALRDKAKTGHPQAASEYREWLLQYGLVSSADAGLEITSMEEWTLDQRAFARAYLERRIARAARLHAPLQRRPRAEEDEASQAAERPTLPPEK